MVDLHTYLQTCCPWFPRLYNNSKYPLSLDCHHMQHTKHHNTVESVPVLQAASAVLTVILLARQCRPVQASAAGVGRAVENSPVTRATSHYTTACLLHSRYLR